MSNATSVASVVSGADIITPLFFFLSVVVNHDTIRKAAQFSLPQQTSLQFPPRAAYRLAYY